MQLRIVSLPQRIPPALVLLATATLLPCSARAQSANPKQQMVYLPDPTPRPIDPHWKLDDNPQAGTSTQEALDHRNQRRRELTVWAADELVTLSARLQADLAQPRTDLATADAVANAQKIEQLARNLAAALKAP
jgi:hypothetical protein